MDLSIIPEKLFKSGNGSTTCIVKYDFAHHILEVVWLKLPTPLMLKNIVAYLVELYKTTNSTFILNDIRGVAGIWPMMINWSQKDKIPINDSVTWCMAILTDNVVQASMYGRYLAHYLSNTTLVESFENKQDAINWLIDCQNLKSISGCPLT